MSVQRLGSIPIAVRKFDVAGIDSEGMPNFLRHLALAADHHQHHAPAAPLSLTHMGPPLHAGTQGTIVHVLGSLPLADDEIPQVELFIDEVRGEYEAHSIRKARDQYVVHPHVREQTAPDGTVIYRRFSCVGFVIEAYREVGIALVVTEERRLPGVPLNTLLLAYPDLQAELQNPRLRRVCGLGGEGPWAVVLPGYVLHSLGRPESEVRGSPYLPREGDEFFPSRAQPLAQENS